MLPASRGRGAPKPSSAQALPHQSRSGWAQAERTSTPLEEKCRECLRAAQPVERLECDSSRASLGHRCGCRQGVMERPSDGERRGASGCFAPWSGGAFSAGRAQGRLSSCSGRRNSLGMDQINSGRVK